jgi:hypothetical protein
VISALILGFTLTVSQQVVAIVTGLLLPVLNGLVMKTATLSEGAKAAIAALIAAIAAVIVQATQADGTAVFTGSLLLTFALVYLPQVASYLGFWKNLNLNEKLAPTKGIGPKEPSA